MNLRVKDVLVRAWQRGYRPAEIRPCLVRRLEAGRYEVDVDSDAYPAATKGFPVTKTLAEYMDLARSEIADVMPQGLGDRVASVLSAVGITESRVSKILGRPCGCPGRRRRLNALGRRIGIG